MLIQIIATCTFLRWSLKDLYNGTKEISKSSFKKSKRSFRKSGSVLGKPFFIEFYVIKSALLSSFQRASYNLRKCYFRFIFSESNYSTNMLSTSWKEILIAYPIIVWLLYSTFRYKIWDSLIYQDIFFYVQYYLLQTLWSSLHVVETRTIFIYFFTSTEWTSVFP